MTEEKKISKKHERYILLIHVAYTCYLMEYSNQALFFPTANVFPQVIYLSFYIALQDLYLNRKNRLCSEQPTVVHYMLTLCFFPTYERCTAGHTKVIFMSWRVVEDGQVI